MRTVVGLVAALILVWVPGEAGEPSGSDMHPAFEVRDADGKPLTAPASGADAVKTCGECHDVETIQASSTHRSHGVSSDCFKCHLASGKPGWPESAFEGSSKLAKGRSGIRSPQASNCASCHGIVTSGPNPVALPSDFGRIPREDVNEQRFDFTHTTGAVFSSDDIRDGHINVEGRDQLNHAWDVHAQRQLTCTSCHYSSNHPHKARRPDGALPHLKNDPRSLEWSEYLNAPSHTLATAQCTDCHEPTAAHDFLPQRERHMRALACQSCHTPVQYAPALASVDATVVDSEGNAVAQWRGVDDEDSRPVHVRLVEGFRPFLLAEQTEAGTKLAPFNLVTTWQWYSGDSAVPYEVVQKAMKNGDVYHPEVMAVLDINGDGSLSPQELRLDSQAKADVLTRRLISAGVKNPIMKGKTEAYPVVHGVMDGSEVTRECSDCHDSRSRLTGVVAASAQRPVGAEHELGERASRIRGGAFVVSEVGVEFVRDASLEGLYVLGFSTARWSDVAGFTIFVMVALGVAAHAGLRIASRKKRAGLHSEPVQRVYMYSTYERIWHWLMAMSVIALLVTGFEIHFGGFGLFGFRKAVIVHNAFAVIMVANAFLAFFFHLASAAIKQFIPERENFLRKVTDQIKYYTHGIFTGAGHPDIKTPARKLNPLQQVTYFLLLNLLFPLQVITGILLWTGSMWPEAMARVGGMDIVAPVHNLGSGLFLSFLTLHLYLTTTGRTPLSNIRAMVDGYDEIPVSHLAPNTTGGDNV